MMAEKSNKDQEAVFESANNQNQRNQRQVQIGSMRIPVTNPHDKLPRKRFFERIRHFTPSWFAVCMGTGAISMILHNFPFGSQIVLSWFGRAMFFVNLFLFILFCCFTLARYAIYTSIWSRMIHHPVQSTFVGCFPMALATLVNGAAYVHRDSGFGGNGLIYVLWAIWWVDLALSYSSCFGMIYFMITRHEHHLEKILATWLLPIVPLVVVSTTGGIVAQELQGINTSHALLTVVISAVSVIIGLTLSFMTITTYLLRLIVYKLPPNTLIVSKFIPLGPLGQGGTAILILAQVIDDLSKSSSLPAPFFSDPLAGSITKFFGFFLALFLWSNGLFWLWIGAASIVEVFSRNKVPFGVPFWGMIFPLGVYILLCLQLGATLNSMFFRIFGSVLACMLFVLYTAISLRSLVMTFEGSMFHAPCLDDSTLLSVGPDIEAQTTDIAGE